jgi:hypothetical protein
MKYQRSGEHIYFVRPGSYSKKQASFSKSPFALAALVGFEFHEVQYVVIRVLENASVRRENGQRSHAKGVHKFGLVERANAKPE